MLENFQLNDKQCGSLEDTVVNDFDQGKEEKAVVLYRSHCRTHPHR